MAEWRNCRGEFWFGCVNRAPFREDTLPRLSYGVKILVTKELPLISRPAERRNFEVAPPTWNVLHKSARGLLGLINTKRHDDMEKQKRKILSFGRYVDNPVGNMTT